MIEYRFLVKNESNQVKVISEFEKHSQILCDKLINFNLQNAGQFDSKEYLVEALLNNVIIGGIIGRIACQSLYIDVLFVDDKFRSQNIGSKLLQIIEEKSLELGCKYSRLNTASFQNAKKFYEKHGYKTVFSRSIWTKEQNKYIDYLMMKNF